VAFEIPKIDYSGRIKELSLGTGPKALTVGKESCYPFYLFEGEIPNPPRIALEVPDMEPEDWAGAALEPYKDVSKDPVAWTQKAVAAYGAEMVGLWLASTDPNGMNRGAQEATKVVKAVADAVDVPLIVWGCANADKDAEVLRMVCEACQGKGLIVGPVQEGNYKQIGAPAIAYKHTVMASTPIDVNLAKQLNILLGNLGVPDQQIIMDPTTGGLGYGIEYSYSVMERIRMAGLVQEDERLQFPMINFVGKEVWKVKEAKLSQADSPTLGDPKERGILMEAVTGMLLALAGSDVLILRHPEAAKLLKEMFASLRG
jgi:acetyl-CoA decarbonylase/synthase complex subunit delta